MKEKEFDLGDRVYILPGAYMVLTENDGEFSYTNEVRNLNDTEEGEIVYKFGDVYNIELSDGTIIEVGSGDFNLIMSESKKRS